MVMGITKKPVEKALFANGIYEQVLEEIIAAQGRSKENVFYMQPFSEKIIRSLNEFPPGEDFKWVQYASTTNNLNQIQYVAEIIGWENKQELSPERFAFVDSQLRKNQPGEEGLYLEKYEKKCINLISITNLRKLSKPIPVSHVFKISDGKSLKSRSRAGGWSYVHPLLTEIPEGLTLKSSFDDEFEKEIEQSLNDNHSSRKVRLETAPKFPTKTAVVSYAFNRNSDVVAEVLLRANGNCELCRQDAPFLKASDGTFYLEVHHWIPLAENGEDTVENAAALCPNCHKNAHFGQFKEFIKLNRKHPEKNN
jgi:predicted HNH restriction endonuclease